MFGSQILEVAVGLVLVYLLLSIVATSVREGIEAMLKSRARHLERGIRELLSDHAGAGFAAELYRHPLVFSLFRGDYRPPPPDDASVATRLAHRWRLNLPSYIPARSFASALLDIAAQRTVAAGAAPPNTRVDLSAIRATLDDMQGVPDQVRQAMRYAIDTAEGDLDRARQTLEAWYDSAMDRVSGWYKRETQWVVLAIALVLTVTLNADTLRIADQLYRNGDTRRALLVEAERRADTPLAGPAPNAAPNAVPNAVRRDSTADRAYAELVDLHLPIGWPNGVHFAWAMIPGLLLTTFAVMLGAPFWFDVLNKFMIIRSTVKPHQKSPEQGSDDRQRPNAEDMAATIAAVTTATTHAMRGVAPPEGFTPPVTTGTSAANAPPAAPTT